MTPNADGSDRTRVLSISSFLNSSSELSPVRSKLISTFVVLHHSSPYIINTSRKTSLSVQRASYLLAYFSCRDRRGEGVVLALIFSRPNAFRHVQQASKQIERVRSTTTHTFRTKSSSRTFIGCRVQTPVAVSFISAKATRSMDPARS